MKKTNKAQKADKKVGKLEGQIKVMRLRKHNKIQYYNSSDSESDSESMPHKKRGATKMTKSRNSKKETENAHYKKGEFNSKIKEIPK